MVSVWHSLAKRLRKKGFSLSEIGRQCGVSPQAVSIALDPEKQKKRRQYVKLWNRKQRADPKARVKHRKIDRESHRRRRAAARKAARLAETEAMEASDATEIDMDD